MQIFYTTLLRRSIHFKPLLQSTCYHHGGALLPGTHSAGGGKFIGVVFLLQIILCQFINVGGAETPGGTDTLTLAVEISASSGNIICSGPKDLDTRANRWVLYQVASPQNIHVGGTYPPVGTPIPSLLPSASPWHCLGKHQHLGLPTVKLVHCA